MTDQKNVPTPFQQQIEEIDWIPGDRFPFQDWSLERMHAEVFDTIEQALIPSQSHLQDSEMKKLSVRFGTTEPYLTCRDNI